MKTTFTLLLVFGVILTGSAQWTTSGANIFNSNTGNVGIGTSTPSSKLDLQGLNVSFKMFKSLFSGKEDFTKGRLEIKADVADQGNTALVSLNRFGSTDEDLIYTLQHPIGNSVSWVLLNHGAGQGYCLALVDQIYIHYCLVSTEWKRQGSQLMEILALV
jgi:hypothetical protein